MTPPPSLKETLLTALAGGATFSAALAQARTLHPEAGAELEALAALPGDAHWNLAPQPRELAEQLTAWRAWSMALVSLLLACGVAVLLARKVMPVLCKQSGGGPDCGSWLLVVAAAAAGGFVIAVIARSRAARPSARTKLVESLRQAAGFAALGLPVGRALQLCLGPTAADAALYPPGDENHALAVEWLDEAAERLAPDRRVSRLLWGVTAAGWVAGFVMAGGIYWRLFHLAGSP